MFLELQDKRVCPQCGSKRFRVNQDITPQSVEELILNRNMICKDCDTSYALKPTKLDKYIALLLGIAITLMGVFFIFDPEWKMPCIGYVGFFVGALC